MREKEESPCSEVDLLRRTHDSLPSSILTLDRDGVVIQVNLTARQMLPTIPVGTELRPALEALTHAEKVDRLLIRREIVTFPGAPEGPDLHWMVWQEPEGDLEILTVWESDWNEVMNQRRAAFTMAASHELRGPLTALQGFAEILNMDTGNLTPEQAEAAEVIERTARHLNVLVEDVFDLSRNSFGELRLHLAETDLAEIIESVAANARPQVEERGQVLDCEIEGTLPRVVVDPARTTQMISNLTGNASIHNPEGTRIEIRARQEGPWIEVTVADDGVGLPFENPADAFHAFQRGEEATAGDRAGSGIGLSITKRLIQLHRGDIQVDSTRGEGTRFQLRFPVDRDQPVPADTPGPV